MAPGVFLLVLSLGLFSNQAAADNCPCYGLLPFSSTEEAVLLHVQFTSSRDFLKSCEDICSEDFCVPLKLANPGETNSSRCNPWLAERVALGDWVTLEWSARDECDHESDSKRKRSEIVVASADLTGGLNPLFVNQTIEMLAKEVEPRVRTANLAPCGVDIDKTGEILTKIFLIGFGLLIALMACFYFGCMAAKS